MRIGKLTLLAMMLSGVLLLCSLVFTSAAPDKKKQKKPVKPAVASKALIAQGKKVYENSGCSACHAIGNKGGRTGPALTHIGKEKKADWLAAQVRDPKKHNPNGMMPAYGPDKISNKDLKELIVYLGSLK
jgi:mono/diheme cytochrome c family protein